MTPAAVRTIVALVIALALSLAAVGVLGVGYMGKRDDVARLEERLQAAEAAAKKCSDATEQLRKDAKTQAAAAQAAIDAAKRQARTANARADAERNRAPAVPGDACASAQAETREWLNARKARANALP